MKICFVLPKVSRYPVGGYKIVFEYANRLVKKGYEVTILYRNEDFMRKYKLPLFVRGMLASYYTRKEPTWFELDQRVQKRSSLSKKDLLVCSHSDTAIATAVGTVEFVDRFFMGDKVYFVQGYENWDIGEEALFATYANGMKKIVIAQWLKEIVDQYSPLESTVIKNPVDSSVYNEIVPREERFPHSIAVLYNELPGKGFQYALQALYKLKEKYSDLQVNMFGRTAYPESLPEWIHYTQNANQQQTVEIYNRSRVMLCASVEEGYGLTGLEGMACGCVLVSTRYRGVLEYANDENAVLVPVKDVDGLVRGVSGVFEDEDLAKKLVSNAAKTVEKLSWDNAMKLFENVL